MHRSFHKYGLLAGIVFCCFVLTGSTYSKRKLFKSEIVEFRKEGADYRLFWKGEPYYIKGAAITDLKYLAEFKELGGNSLRTYSTYKATEILDSAQALGLSVFLGLDLGKAGLDFDPENMRSRDSIKQKVKEEVLKYKDHPALLAWGLGNEVHLFLQRKIHNIHQHIILWKFMNEIARLIHELDNNHPVTTAIPRVGPITTFLVETFCREIDFLSINSSQPFGPNESLGSNTMPYLVSEISCAGYWSAFKTDWHAMLEPTSSQKIEFINHHYKSFQLANSLGSYAFIWGQKHEYTSTWFSLFTEKGEMTDVAVNFGMLWGRKKGNKKNSSIRNVMINQIEDSKNIYLNKDREYSIELVIETNNHSLSTLSWEVLKDDIEYLDASYKTLPKKVVVQDSLQLGTFLQVNKLQNFSGIHRYKFKIIPPAEEGPHRILFFLRNSNAVVSTASICFYVRN